MKLKEIITEYNAKDSMDGDIDTDIMMAKANGISKLSPDNLIKSLQNKGHVITKNSLLGKLRSSKLVKSASDNEVELSSSSEGEDEDSNVQRAEKTVDRLSKGGSR